MSSTFRFDCILEKSDICNLQKERDILSRERLSLKRLIVLVTF